MQANDSQGVTRTLVKPIDDKYLRAHLEKLSLDHFVVRDRTYKMSERQQILDKFKDNAFDYAASFLKNLERFPFLYVLNGNTHYIDTIVSMSQGISYFQDDYRYYAIAAKSFGKTSADCSDLIFSFPSWQFGDEKNLVQAKSSPREKRHLDVSYLGLVHDYAPPDVSMFETIGISFSKTLSLPYNRIAVMFSKQRVLHLEAMQMVGHCNLSGAAVATSLLEFMESEFWIKKYWSQYLDLCRANSLRPTNNLLVAYDLNGKRTSMAELFAGAVG